MSTEEELMNRLQSQFGDLDLKQFMSSETMGDDGNKDTNIEDDVSSEESSLEEPTSEELKAWQEKQFEKGQAALEEKKRKEAQSAIQRRRALLQKKRQGKRKEGGDDHDVDVDVDDDEDWEQVAALPNLQGMSSIFFPLQDEYGNEFVGGFPPRLQQLVEDGGDADILGTNWKRLYSSADGDGLSFYNLLETLRGYPGPTVLLIGTIPAARTSLSKTNTSDDKQNRTTIGFYTASPWIESVHYTGTSDCFLFAMNDQDNVHFFKPQPIKHGNNKEPHYMYLHPSSLKQKSTTSMSSRRRQGQGNTSSNHRQSNNPNQKTDGLVHGLGVGGTASQPRLHLTESLEDCRAMDYCPLFEPGDLLLGHGQESLNYFDVDCLELWAVGGDDWIADSLIQQTKERAISEAALAMARQVDKREILRDFQGGLIHTGTGRNNFNNNHGYFAHVQHTTDRCDV